MPSIRSKTRLFSCPTWPHDPTVLCGLSHKENQKSFAMSNYTSAIRYQSLYENRNSWNLLWLERKSSAPQEDCSRLTALCDFPGLSAAREAAPEPLLIPCASTAPSPYTLTSHKTISIHPSCLSDPSLLVLFLMPLLGASGGSRTTAVLIPRLPTSTPTLAKRFLRVPVSYPHYHVASAEHPHGSHCPGDCTKSSKQDPKVGTVSFKLQT